MTAKLLTAATIAAAGLTLAACQTTGVASPASTEGRACVEFGLEPGTEEYAECIDVVRDEIRSFENEIRGQYPFDVRIDCEVDVYQEGRWVIHCEVDRAS